MEIIRDILTAQIRIRLDEEDFDTLVSGKILTSKESDVQPVHIMLADIGYEHMIAILEKKADNLHKI